MQTFNGTDLDPRYTRDDALEDPLSLQTNTRTLWAPDAQDEDGGQNGGDGGDMPQEPGGTEGVPPAAPLTYSF